MGKNTGCERALCPSRKARAVEAGCWGRTLIGAQGRLVCSAGCRLPEERWFYIPVPFAARQAPAWKAL